MLCGEFWYINGSLTDEQVAKRHQRVYSAPKKAYVIGVTTAIIVGIGLLMATPSMQESVGTVVVLLMIMSYVVGVFYGLPWLVRRYRLWLQREVRTAVLTTGPYLRALKDAWAHYHPDTFIPWKLLHDTPKAKLIIEEYLMDCELPEPAHKAKAYDRMYKAARSRADSTARALHDLKLSFVFS